MKPFTPPAAVPLSDMGALDLAASLAVAAERWDEQVHDADLTRELWEARIAQQRADRWARLDREVPS